MGTAPPALSEGAWSGILCHPAHQRKTEQSYLADIDRQAEELFLRLVKQMAETEGVTEALKTANPIEWVGRMNNIRNRAMEIVNGELIYGV